MFSMTKELNVNNRKKVEKEPLWNSIVRIIGIIQAAGTKKFFLERGRKLSKSNYLYYKGIRVGRKGGKEFL